MTLKIKISIALVVWPLTASCIRGKFKVGAVKNADQIAELKFVVQPSVGRVNEVLSTQPQIELLSKSGVRVHKGDMSRETVVLEISSGEGKILGTSSITAVDGIAKFTNLYFDTKGVKVLKASVNSGKVFKNSESFTVLAGPSISLVGNSVSDQVFCPRFSVVYGDVPSGATKYCLNLNSTDINACEWKSMPLPAGIKLSGPNTPTTYNLWYQDASGSLLTASSGVLSNTVSTKSTQLPDSSSWLSLALGTSITGPQIDELTCRIDELSKPQAVALARQSVDAFDTPRRKHLSEMFNQHASGKLGVNTASTAAEIQVAYWRLIVSTQVKGIALKELDVSGIDLDGRNIAGFNFANSNLKATQLNNLADYSSLNLAGLDLGGLVLPSKATNFLTLANLAGTKNIPWADINRLCTSVVALTDFSELDLKDWQPQISAWVLANNFTNAKNLPWSLLNPNSSSQFYSNTFKGVDMTGFNPTTTAPKNNYSGAINMPWSALNSKDISSSNLSGLDLSSWSPISTESLSYMDLSGATNVPWSAINANTHSNGYLGMNLAGLDLSAWNPGTTKSLASVNISNATNIPWAALNANSNALSFGSAKMEGLNLASFSPNPALTINSVSFLNSTNMPFLPILRVGCYGCVGFSTVGADLTGWNPTTQALAIDFTGTTNIPWAAINANSYSGGYMGANFTGVNLSSWSPPTTSRITNITYTNATNIPWAALNANTETNGYGWSIFNGVDLTGWNPATTKSIRNIKYVGATNIPWAALNANTNSNGVSGSDFTGQNLIGWNPPTTQNISGVILKNATNIPWAAISANTNAAGTTSISFSGLNLASWNPPVSANLSYLKLTGATNIPWAAINANTNSNGLNHADFTDVDLAGWNPAPTVNLTYINFTRAKNIPWTAINANINAAGFSNTDFTNTDIEGFNPTPTGNSAKLGGILLPLGAKSPRDLVDIIGVTPNPALKWTDGTLPWSQ